MIRVENVSKQFNKTRALKNVSLEVNKGDIISLIGPSGSGKSTLLRCIHGLEHVDTGKISMSTQRLEVGKSIGNFYGMKSVGVSENGLWIIEYWKIYVFI